VEAAAPAVLEVPGKGRVLIFSYCSPTSGVPWKWAATTHRPGVNFLEDISKKTARHIAREMRGFNRENDFLQIHYTQVSDNQKARVLNGRFLRLRSEELEDALLSCFPAEWICSCGVGYPAALHPAYITQK
jgi:hypothetical protein